MFRHLRVVTQVQHELGLAGRMQECLVAAIQSGTKALALAWSVPGCGCGDRAGVTGEADDQRITGVLFACQLSEADVTGGATFLRATVAQVCVMRPDDSPNGFAFPFEMRNKG